jgi:hypothetical protein
MKSTTRMRRRCACGNLFVDKHGDQWQCTTCRPPWSREKAPPLPEEERWRRWLLAELEPFHGLTVRVNDLILHLRDQSEKSSAA